MMLTEVFRLTGLLLGLLTFFTTDAFFVPQKQQQPLLLVQQRAFFSAPLQMAGFGASSKKGKASKKDSGNTKKLKPRQQWDRFISDDLKTSDSVRVAVRVVPVPASLSPDKWFEVGEIKSKDNAYTEASVIRHRMLIADHARRMFPLQILANDKLDWGYSYSSDTENRDAECEWKIAGKIENMPGDIDKMIGFKGLPDPTGFYSSAAITSMNTDQTGYNSMKSKGITGHHPLEVHT
mmetsp:Transcript_3099/g.3580  ORF Transcript_3099/g.3580 Transcript_3099/m.3580 type:complete len:236 (-) Transcript_3099:29-736(-)